MVKCRKPSVLVSLHLICLDDIEQAMGVGGGAGYRAGNGGRWGGQDIEQAMGVGGGVGYRAGNGGRWGAGYRAGG